MTITDLTSLDEQSFRRIASDPKYSDIIHAGFAYLLESCSAEKARELWGSYFLITKEGSRIDTEQALAFLGSAKAGWYEICTSDGTHVSDKDHIREVFTGLREDEAASVRKVLPAELCGYIFYTPDDKIFIEAFRGWLNGLSEALDMPSYYVIDRSGTVCSKYESDISEYYLFDTHLGRWTLHSSEGTGALALNDDQLETLCELLRVINQNRIFMKLAWACCGGSFHIIDIALPMGLGIVE